MGCGGPSTSKDMIQGQPSAEDKLEGYKSPVSESAAAFEGPFADMYKEIKSDQQDPSMLVIYSIIHVVMRRFPTMDKRDVFERFNYSQYNKLGKLSKVHFTELLQQLLNQYNITYSVTQSTPVKNGGMWVDSLGANQAELKPIKAEPPAVKDAARQKPKVKKTIVKRGEDLSAQLRPIYLKQSAESAEFVEKSQFLEVCAQMFPNVKADVCSKLFAIKAAEGLVPVVEVLYIFQILIPIEEKISRKQLRFDEDLFAQKPITENTQVVQGEETAKDNN